MPVINFLTTCIFDHGAIKQLQGTLDQKGVKRPFIVTDPGIVAAGLLDRVNEVLKSEPAGVFSETVPNPIETQTKQVTALYKESGADGIIALGGGSSMDHAKGVAILAAHGGKLEEYAAIAGGMEKIGKLPPLIAIPTTAGTGSEVSVGAIITLENGRKETFASLNLVPAAAICDPELTLGLPKHLTAATGMDAVTHCIESVLTPNINPPAEGIGYDGARRALGGDWLRRAVKDGSDKEARWNMMMASYEGALAFTKGLGGVHALSHAAGRMHEKRLHHGTLNAVFLPHILREHAPVVEEKFARIRETIGLKPGGDLAEYIEELNSEIGIPANLSEMGVEESDGPGIVEYALKDLSHLGNPKMLTAEDYARVFKIALG